MDLPLEELIAFRRNTLHVYPEIGGEEVRTAAEVTGFLQQYNPDEIYTGLGGHGVAVVFYGKEPGRTVLFRAELDALPIQEINSFAHRSTRDGISHKCGHDGHSTILCGVAALLSKERPASGKVILLFQPSEENGVGAAAILADEKFKLITPDHVFSLHNIPGAPTGEIMVKDGYFTPAVNSIIIKVNGITSHAGEPEQGINPALAMAEIMKQAVALTLNMPSSDEFALVTPVYQQMGERAYGISAGEGEIHLTLRCWTMEKRLALEQQIESIAKQVAEGFKLKVAFSYLQGFFPNENTPWASDIVRSAARKLDYSIHEMAYPFRWGEDFGSFTTRYSGAMFGLGAGLTIPALHNPDYDFPDEIIPFGSNMFYQIAREILR